MHSNKLSSVASRLRRALKGPIPRPPLELMVEIGAPDANEFEVIGQEFVGYLVDLAGLRPSDQVLDIGSGVGRMAIPLTRVLSTSGSYRGFDTFLGGVQWCQREITSRFENFVFEYIDLYSKRYNPGASIKPSEFPFPYPEASFDVASATSVFTHMVPMDVRHYLEEVRRVLRPGGRCLATFFLIDPISRDLHSRGSSLINFPVDNGDHLIANEQIPEEAVAYPVEVLEEAYAQAGLRIASIYPGKWSGREEGLTGQDLIISTKEGP